VRVEAHEGGDIAATAGVLVTAEAVGSGVIDTSIQTPISAIQRNISNEPGQVEGPGPHGRGDQPAEAALQPCR